MNTANLVGALGHPAPWVALPSRRSPAWGAILKRIEDFTNLHGLLTRKRPNWLWGRLRQCMQPKKIYWGDLLQGWAEADSDRIRQALIGPRSAEDVTFISWNASLLVDLLSTRVRAKRARIENALRKG